MGYEPGHLTWGRLSDVSLKVHWTFLLLIAWIAFAELNRGSTLSQALLTISYVLSIFVCVIPHKFGPILSHSISTSL